MAWVAFDRGIKSAEEFGLPGPIDEWRRIRLEIHEDVCRKGFDAELGCFVRAYGTKELDSSLLLTSSIGFLPPTDQRVQATVHAIERKLMVDGFVQRHNAGGSDDRLSTDEGAFIACSFWMVEAYLLLGRHEDAKQLFERLLKLRSDVGLLSEEYDPKRRRLLGNFPQAPRLRRPVREFVGLQRARRNAGLRADRKGRSHTPRDAPPGRAGRHSRCGAPDHHAASDG